MKLFLNNLLKGLLTALVVVSLGGFISLNIKIPPTKTMVLVSSSLVNSIKTEDSTNVIEIADENEEEIDVQIEENIESNEDEKDLDSNLDTEDQVIESDNTDNSNSSSQETNTPVQEPSQEENTETEEVSVKGEYAPNLEVVNTISPIETYYGKITAYGPDCYGCTTGMTASGQYVMDGNIYYYDETFGNIRIVAADSSIPFGSIIKITGLNISSDPVIAIVLDRGGAIGFASGKHAYFDLLYKSEQDALSFGVQTATFELLRKSY